MIRRRLPDFVIGGRERPYMRRWWLIPRNRWFNVYLHQILRDDDDRALHDHPWWNLSIVLRGSYVEVMPDFRGAPTPHARIADLPVRRKWRGSGSVVLRRPTAAHRLEVYGRPCWTLFITGPRIREWGFHCAQGWVPWRDFVDQQDTGQVGRGCGEP